MRYNEAEELISTKEWLIKFNEVGFSDELMYVPSQLSKMGIAPIDVVDRLDWLKGKTSEESGSVVEDVPISSLEEAGALILNYDGYGAWEWAEPIEKMVEESFASVFDLDPDLPDFNELVSLSRSRQRSKGKRARVALIPPLERVDELVSEKSVDTIS